MIPRETPNILGTASFVTDASRDFSTVDFFYNCAGNASFFYTCAGFFCAFPTSESPNPPLITPNRFSILQLRWKSQWQFPHIFPSNA
jgi:hypothetical protein